MHTLTNNHAEPVMQSVAHNGGYRSDGAWAAKPWSAPAGLQGLQGLPEAIGKERKQGQALLREIHGDQRRLSPKMRNLAEFCLRNVHALHRMRIMDLAGQTGNIPSTVVRFAKRYGYVGFHDFKLAFLQEPGHAAAPLSLHAALWELEMASFGAMALKDVVGTPSFQQAVRWTTQARRVGVLARSADDLPVALHLQARLQHVHTASLVRSEPEYLQGGFAVPVDVLFDIDIGLDARPPDYGQLLPGALTPCVRITATPSSAFSSHAMAHLGLFSCGGQPEHLVLAGMALVNALCACCREEQTGA